MPSTDNNRMSTLVIQNCPCVVRLDQPIENVNTKKVAIQKMLRFCLEYEPVHEKTNNLGFQPGLTQTGLYSHRRWLEA